MTENIFFQLIKCLQIKKSISQMESFPQGKPLCFSSNVKKDTFKVTPRCEYFMKGLTRKKIFATKLILNFVDI